MASQFLLGMSVTALAIGLIAIVIVVLFRGAAPGARNLVWNTALLACAVAPVSLILGPRVTIRIPAPLVASASRAIHATPGTMPVVVPGARAQPSSSAPAWSWTAPRATGVSLSAVWICGMLFFAIRFFRQLRFVRALVRRATPGTHNDFSAVLARAKSALDVRVAVSVLESAEIDIPIATGIFHPVILLPAYANEWTGDELYTVLLHELAHVKRADVRARAGAILVCGLHWFNPVVWLMSAAAMRNAELAADDLVLHAGVRASSYADTLLNLADRMLNFPNAQPAMSLGRPALLADRVHAILRESGIRRDIKGLTRSTVMIGSCALATLAACIRFSSAVPDTRVVQENQAAFVESTALPEPLPDAPTSTQPSARAKPKAIMRGEGERPVNATIPHDSTWLSAATDGLIAALDDPSPQVRGGAAHSLGQLGAVRAHAPLSSLVNDPDKYVRYEARNALSALNRAP